MPTICDTHILLFWAHEPERLSGPALQALERGRLVLPADVSADVYLKQLLAALRLQVPRPCSWGLR